MSDFPEGPPSHKPPPPHPHGGGHPPSDPEASSGDEGVVHPPHHPDPKPHPDFKLDPKPDPDPEPDPDPDPSPLSSLLPVYPLTTLPVTEERLRNLGSALFGLQGGRISSTPERLILQEGPHRVELLRASGGVWASNIDKLFRVPKRPHRPNVPVSLDRAREVMGDKRVTPEQVSRGLFRLTPTARGGTVMRRVFDEGEGGRSSQEWELDADFAFSLSLPLKEHHRDPFPLVGPGGHVGMTFDLEGRVIGHRAAFRPIAGKPILAEVLPLKTVWEEYIHRLILENRQGRRRREQRNKESESSILAALRHLDEPPSESVRLGYYLAGSTVEQNLLHPVYTVDLVLSIQGKRLPLPQIVLPATRIASQPEWRNGVVPTEGNDEAHPHPPPSPREARDRVPGKLHAAAMYLGDSVGLNYASGNARAVMKRLKERLFWEVLFEWGDEDAAESDFVGTPDAASPVDEADLLFYTGHAGPTGWMISNAEGAPTAWVDAKEADEDDVNQFRWGSQHLKWLIIAACGPLETTEDGVRDPVDRWEGAFNGLRLLLGFASASAENWKEGSTFMDNAEVEGVSLQAAWFTTAHQCQPLMNPSAPPFGPYVQVAAMFPETDDLGNSPADDRLLAVGQEILSIPSPTSFIFMKKKMNDL